MRFKVCFIGGARYTKPLDATSKKKFQALEPLAEIFVIGFSPSYRPKRFNQHARFYLLSQFRLPMLRYLELFIVGLAVACWVVFRDGVQILVAQSPYEGCVAALAKKITGWFGCRVALVVESHGDFEESLFLQRTISFTELYRFAMRSTARFALRHADCVRVISDSTREQMVRWAPGRRIVQFPTWTDIEVFLRAGLENKGADEQQILYTGVLVPRKGVHHLINAVSSLTIDFPQARLIIVGREDDKVYASELKERVKMLGLDGRVRFLSPMPQVELAMWMRCASMFVLPSISEGLGRVAVEAMATGTLVIGSDVGGIPQIVEDTATGFLVPPGDERALAEKIRWVFEHPAEAGEMGRRAQTVAERFFCTKNYVAGYQDIFSDCSNLLLERDEHAPSTL